MPARSPQVTRARLQPFREHCSKRTGTADVARYVDEAHEQGEVSELAEWPTDALQGARAADAEAAKEACGARTIRQLAEHRFIRAA